MGYLNNTEVIVDAILTKKGRQKLASGQALNITKFALGDDEVDYRPVPSPSQWQVFDLWQDDDRPGQEEEETKRKYLSWNDRFSYGNS